MNQLKQNKNINEIVVAWSKFLNKDVSYLPVLGPIYTSGNPIKELLFDLLKNAEIDKFLPYDKNKRWFQKKTEKIISSAITINNKEIFIPVKDESKNSLKIFYYSNNHLNNKTLTKLKAIYKNLKDVQNINKLSFYCFIKPHVKTRFVCHNIYLKKLTPKDSLSKLPEGINYYNKLPNKIQSTFSNIGKEPDLNNFNFLWKKFINKNKRLNSIICAVSSNKIIGAIGPLDISKDAWGILFLFAPHFGIIKKKRGKGIGRKLWQVAMNFAYQNGAKYMLVQSLQNSPADRFYENQKLSIINKVYSSY